MMTSWRFPPPSRPKFTWVAPEGSTYVVVEKVREKGRIVRGGSRVTFGSAAAVALTVGMSEVSRAINTAFIERQNGTDRHRNARKIRQTDRFSKNYQFHEAVTSFSMFSSNFCWAVRTLTIQDEKGQRQRRSPAMVAVLIDHLWSMFEWLARPAIVQHA